MNQVTASIPDSTRSYVTSMFSRDQLRGITVYFGIGEERPFYVEKTPSLLMERVRHNFSFFYLNYLLSTCVFFLLSLITNLSALIGMMLIACVWLWFIKASSSGSLVVGCKLVAEPSLFFSATLTVAWTAISIPQKTASIGLAIFTLFALFYLLQNVFWYAFFWSGLVAGTHAVLRDASMHKDMDDQVAMEGEVTLGQEGTFFNDGGV